MVQVLAAVPKKRTFMQNLGMGIERGLEAAKPFVEQYQQNQVLNEENKALQEKYGIDLAGIKDQNVRREMIANKLKGQNNQQDLEIEKRDYGTVKDTFGEKFANLWRSQPVGARTELIKTAMEANQRGYNLEEMLGGLQPQQPQEKEMPKQEEIEAPIIKTKDFDKGLTPKERTRRQEARYSTNLPLYQKSVDKRNSYETIQDDIGILEELSPKIGALERLNINPSSGDIAIPFLASPEAQRYVKTINEFSKAAKDTYGARVTNFDLTQFMKRLPTLANSEEGRNQILQQMDIITKINMAQEKALQDVIEDHGGIRNIDFDKAEELARKKSNKEIASLRGQFKDIDKKVNNQFDRQVEDFKKTIPKDRVAVRNNDGTMGHIPKDMVKKYLEDKVGEIL